jgi:hypothetical protein
MDHEHVTDTPTTRGGFVRKLGTMAAIGLGVALVPARSAFGAQSQCCPNSSQCPNLQCPAGYRPHWCTGGCGGCCACLTQTSCFWFSGGCPC